MRERPFDWEKRHMLISGRKWRKIVLKIELEPCTYHKGREAGCEQ
jgi:hypothetical protein